MGRPPLNHTRVHVSLPPDALERLDQLVGTYGRAKFIREAVQEKLDREAK